MFLTVYLIRIPYYSSTLRRTLIATSQTSKEQCWQLNEKYVELNVRSNIDQTHVWLTLNGYPITCEDIETHELLPSEPPTNKGIAFQNITS